MRYNEIINEDTEELMIDSIKKLNTMLSYGEVKLPDGGLVNIRISTPITIDFPEKFTIYGDLIVGGYTKHITGDLTVLGDFTVNTKILSLPDNMYVKGTLDIVFTPIEFLPKGLKIKEHLILEDTKITTLPPDLIIGGDLYLERGISMKIPDTVQIGGQIRNLV